MKDNTTSVQHTSEGLNCPRCGTATIVSKAPFYIRDEYIGLFEAIVCKMCNYSLFTPEGYDSAMLEARKYGLVGPPEDAIKAPDEIIKETVEFSEQQLVSQELVVSSNFTNSANVIFNKVNSKETEGSSLSNSEEIIMNSYPYNKKYYPTRTQLISRHI